MKLLACPICGKYPIVCGDYFGDECRVECRPTAWFGIRRNAHMIVYGETVLGAVDEWNRAVMDYWKPVDAKEDA